MGFRRRVPLALQVAAVVALLATSLATLWEAGESLVRRDRRRAEASRRLVRAEERLAAAGARLLILVPEWPDTLSNSEWATLDRWLTDETRATLQPFEGLDAGFYVPSGNRYLGRAFQPSRREGDLSDASRNPSDPPPRDRALVEAQILRCLDDDRTLSILVDSPSQTLALRTTPLWINDRQVAAVWTLDRLDERPTVASTIRAYRNAAGLALGGVVLALLIALGLWLTVRRQSREGERLQADLRRSERLAALGKLLAGVAHEVRNPLAGIRSTAQLWERGIEPDRESIADLVAEVDRLEAIVSRLLQFSRADAEPLAPGDLNEVVAEAARLARPVAERQGVAVDLSLAPGPIAAQLSSRGLLQVLRNLTTNALQAMPEGGTLRLWTRHDPARGIVEATVIDSGPGLPGDVHAHLFEPFFTTKPDGTGLGLAIAREIALAHGGDLKAENRKDGRGAIFTLTIPSACVKAVKSLDPLALA